MTRQITLLERSVVVVGQNHNPSILNPDFLWRHHIVPEEIKLADGEPSMSTPMASQCTFESGLHIVSDPNRISFIDTVPGGGEEGSISCYETAKKYLRTVPLVRYVAVGINFIGFFPDIDSKSTPCSMLREQLQSEFDGASPSAEIILTYAFAKLTVNLTIKHAQAHENEKKVIFHGNCHHEIKADSNESHKVAIAIVDDWENDLMCFKQLATRIAESIGGERL